MSSREALLQRIDAYLNAAPRAACDVEQVGPFTLFFRHASPMPALNYARPSALLMGDLREDIDHVRAAFARRGLVCRWEFLADLVQDFRGILIQNGFPEPIPRPLMVVTRETFRPESSAVAEIRPIGMEETRPVDRVLHEAFGLEAGDSKATETEDVDLLRAALEQGAVAYAAFIESRPVASGLHVPIGDTTEVAGIGTLPAFRRRGIAGAITSALVADAFAKGCDCVFLSAADESVQRVYARLGFEKIGVAMDTADESPPGDA